MRQDQAYRDAVLPPSVRKRVSVEVGVSLGWERWVGDEGAIIGLDHYGASAPAGTIFEKFGFTADRVAEVARKVVRDGLHGRIPTRRRRPLRPAPDDRERRGRRRPDERLGPRPQLTASAADRRRPRRPYPCAHARRLLGRPCGRRVQGRADPPSRGGRPRARADRPRRRRLRPDSTTTRTSRSAWARRSWPARPSAGS